MKYGLALASVLTLTACSGGVTMPDLRAGRPAPAEPVAVAPTPQPVMLTAKERLVGAIERNGCLLTADNVGTILTQATIGREELTRLTAELNAEGRAEVSGDGAIRVMTSQCI